MEHQDDTPRSDAEEQPGASPAELGFDALGGPPGEPTVSSAAVAAGQGAAGGTGDDGDAGPPSEAPAESPAEPPPVRPDAPSGGVPDEPLPIAGVDGEPPPITMAADDPLMRDTGPSALHIDEDVRPAELQEFTLASPDCAPSNIDILSDVVLPITVELGRVSTRIRDLLQTGPGSVIQLDRQTSDPVDILAGGRLIARGEVVVVGQSMGVRITELVQPARKAS